MRPDGHVWYSGIPRGQEKHFHAFNLSAFYWRALRLFIFDLLRDDFAAFERAVSAGKSYA